ncbi:hypothetical protein QBC39DRAFT_134932 [Podospora conica]|nr:hypothetical protein QBC39DRAFT_134932 [Schizothecium conicum]
MARGKQGSVCYSLHHILLFFLFLSSCPCSFLYYTLAARTHATTWTWTWAWKKREARPGFLLVVVVRQFGAALFLLSFGLSLCASLPACPPLFSLSLEKKQDLIPLLHWQHKLRFFCYGFPFGLDGAISLFFGGGDGWWSRLFCTYFFSTEVGVMSKLFCWLGGPDGDLPTLT